MDEPNGDDCFTWRASDGELAGPVTVMRHMRGSFGTGEASTQLKSEKTNYIS